MRRSRSLVPQHGASPALEEVTKSCGRRASKLPRPTTNARQDSYRYLFISFRPVISGSPHGCPLLVLKVPYGNLREAAARAIPRLLITKCAYWSVFATLVQMRSLLAFSVFCALPVAAQTPDWSKVNEEAMRQFQALIRIDTTDPPGAEAITGWKQADAVGRDQMNIFKVLNLSTHQPAESAVVQVIRNKIAYRSDEPRIVVAQDGTETTGNETAAPIINHAGNIVGVVLVFRS